MHIRFGFLKLHNFNAHRDLDVKFGDLTEITGDNGLGKSSILAAIPFLFYGVDLMGSKFDPTPTNYSYDFIRVELQFFIDEKEVRLARGIENGEACYWVNEVPSKATEFNDLVKTLFDKDLFLSLFYPPYFFSLKWDEQRALILRYATAPANKEVFAKLSKMQADSLAEQLKKRSLADLDKIHRENKTKQDKALIAAQSRTKTLQEQLQRLPQSTLDIEATQAEIAKLDEQIKAAESGKQDEVKRAVAQCKSNLDSYLEQIKSLKDDHAAAKAKPVEDTCNVCGQELIGPAKDLAVENHAKTCSALAEKVNKLIEQAKTIKAKLAEQQALLQPETDEPIDVEALRSQKQSLFDAIREKQQREQFEQQIEAAKNAEDATLGDRNISIFILDAIKAFKAKEAELQADKLQSLFTTLSLRLFKENKGDGEIKPDFEIEMDGKPYRKLSFGESIRAGMELAEVLGELSGIVTPRAVDNTESAFRIKKPAGQLIKVKAIEDGPLKIETEEAK